MGLFLKNSENINPKEFLGAILFPEACISHSLLGKIGKQKRKGRIESLEQGRFEASSRGESLVLGVSGAFLAEWA